MITWRLGKGKDRRFRQGHPWVFASELGHSAKEVRPGEPVELRDAQDHFLAYGYGHPSSQICFRRLSSRKQDSDVLSERFFVERLRAARELRQQAGWSQASHRWLYAEADGVPGLIVDAFLTVDQGWLVVVQASTSGIENALPQVYSALQTFAKSLGLMSIVVAPSSKSRTLEGLKIEGKQLISGGASRLESGTIRLHHGLNLTCDLLQGQKTGFFLDQQWNAGLLRQLVRAQFDPAGGARRARPVRVLDICCYVGQWAAHAAQVLQKLEVAVEVTLLDTSLSALQLARPNLQALDAQAEAVHGDALEKVSALPEGHFDVVICDPPAFVKKKADLEAGTRAYAKLNRDALRTVVPGGLFVASSCSGLVKAADWQEVLLQASSKAGRQFKQLLRGGHAPDHPIRAEFLEGEYLKCDLGRVEYPY